MYAFIQNVVFEKVKLRSETIGAKNKMIGNVFITL